MGHPESIRKRQDKRKNANLTRRCLRKRKFQQNIRHHPHHLQFADDVVVFDGTKEETNNNELVTP